MQKETKKMATSAQKQMIYGLCRYNKGAKEEAVSSISNKRTTSTNDLYQYEADILIKRLQGQKANIETPRHLQFDLSRSKQSYILSLCQQLGWIKAHKKYGSVADMQILYDWLMSSKSPVNKC